MMRSKFARKSTPSRGPIAKPQYLPHTWTRPTYGAKRLPDAICRFSTMHWTDRQTDRPTDRPTDRSRENLMTIGRCAPRATRPNNNCIKIFLKLDSGKIQKHIFIIKLKIKKLTSTELSNDNSAWWNLTDNSFIMILIASINTAESLWHKVAHACFLQLLNCTKKIMTSNNNQTNHHQSNTQKWYLNRIPNTC